MICRNTDCHGRANTSHINVVRFGPLLIARQEQNSVGHTAFVTVIPFPSRRLALRRADGVSQHAAVRAIKGRVHEDSYFADADDYRSRMLINLVALAVVIVLVAAGSWSFGTIAKTSGSPHLLTSIASGPKNV